MDVQTASSLYADSRHEGLSAKNESLSSGASWGAVMGGAFVAAAFYLMLLALGAGFGLSAVSPWSNTGASAAALVNASIVWLVGTNIIAGALGGYITGRLRTKWALIHTDEVFFRDTANGLMAWAVALVVSLTFLATAATYMAGGVATTRSPMESTVSSATPADANAYFVDTLFRSDRPVNETKESSVPEDAGRVFAHALVSDQAPAADQTYLARLVSARTGITQEEAERRVADVIAEGRQAADTTRKAAARMLLWYFLAVLTGAFSACYFATIGGKLRDHVHVV
jgi:hypothetical protein